MNTDEIYKAMLQHPNAQREFLDKLLALGKLKVSRPISELVDEDINILFQKVWAVSQSGKPQELSIDFNREKAI